MRISNYESRRNLAYTRSKILYFESWFEMRISNHDSKYALCRRVKTVYSSMVVLSWYSKQEEFMKAVTSSFLTPAQQETLSVNRGTAVLWRGREKYLLVCFSPLSRSSFILLTVTKYHMDMLCITSLFAAIKKLSLIFFNLHNVLQIHTFGFNGTISMFSWSDSV